VGRTGINIQFRDLAGCWVQAAVPQLRLGATAVVCSCGYCCAAQAIAIGLERSGMTLPGFPGLRPL
jgi:hypothetical protein